jgi:hypothetical protein
VIWIAALEQATILPVKAGHCFGRIAVGHGTDRRFNSLSIPAIIVCNTSTDTTREVAYLSQ